MGSIEINVYEKDKRMRVVYPTRGLVLETDNLFGRDGGELDGLFIYLRKKINAAVEPSVKGERYSLDTYAEDREKYDELVYPHLPDLDRDI